jgi:predicted acetyltransferase
MPFDVRTVADNAEYRDALLGIGQYFGMEPTDEDIDRFVAALPLERMYAAHENGRIVGGAGSFAFDLSVPGARDVRCAGVSVVGVAPTHRRRGALSAMMRAQLDAVHEAGEPLAALWASEETIYGRYGYGLAAWGVEGAVPHEYAGFVKRIDPVGTVRLVEMDEALELFPPLHEELRRQRPGAFARSRRWWEMRVLRDPPERRQGAGPKRFVVHETDGRATGYAIYRHKFAYESGVPASELIVLEAFGVTRAADHDVWRYLLDVDWAAKVKVWMLPLDHPLVLMLGAPRRPAFRIGDTLWVRLVDVGAALSARAYRDGPPVVFEVRDTFCAWNEGRWKLADGSAERTDDEPDLRCDVDALGSVYLGGATFAQLERALRVEEVHAGRIRRADDLFRTDIQPWCPEIF